MKQIVQPALWLLVIIIGLPQLSETIYTPSLPDIAEALHVSEAWIEYTLTVYLFGFAVGTLFWGNLSDRFGRKPCTLVGLGVYLLGCAGCYYSASIEMLLLSRFFQAFGGSTGSVLGQAICRDAFHGKDCGRAYSVIGSAIAFAPAIGPIMGGLIDEMYGWEANFLFLLGIGTLTLFLTKRFLPETAPAFQKKGILLKEIAFRLLNDRRAMAYGILIAASNGITFSYYAEGSFYLIDQLQLTPSYYGMTFIGFAVAGITGGILSRKMLARHASKEVLAFGVQVMFAGAAIFGGMTGLFHFLDAGAFPSIVLTLASMITIMLGIGIMIPNALSLALIDYREAIGTASSLFGFFYYTLISVITFGMGMLHNSTLLPMPFYFLGLTILMWAITFKVILVEEGKRNQVGF